MDNNKIYNEAISFEDKIYCLPQEMINDFKKYSNSYCSLHLPNMIISYNAIEKDIETSEQLIKMINTELYYWINYKGHIKKMLQGFKKIHERKGISNHRSNILKDIHINTKDFINDIILSLSINRDNHYNRIKILRAFKKVMRQDLHSETEILLNELSKPDNILTDAVNKAFDDYINKNYPDNKSYTIRNFKKLIINDIKYENVLGFKYDDSIYKHV